jgi:glycosyltransferase involved in cell wall biosynthesis
LFLYTTPSLGKIQQEEALPAKIKGNYQRVCHISTVHPWNDIRIFWKECQTLRKVGYEVYLVVSRNQDEEIHGIKIISLPYVKTRFARSIKNGILAYRKALGTGSDLFHIHDPELIPIGLFLSHQKKMVIYDVHEDVTKTILNKEWIWSFMRKPISAIIEKFEKWSVKRMSSVIAATPGIRKRFWFLQGKAVDIKNYPLLNEFQDINQPWNSKERVVCYVGSIDRYRGIVEMTQAIGLTEGKLFLVGSFSPASQRRLVNHLSGWERVAEMGQLDRSGVTKVLGRSMAGLVLLHPRANYLDSLPIKMFEYMSAGIPVIASNFPLWEKIIYKEKCGLCCDPLKPEQIAQAIHWIFDHPDEAQKMGERGRQAVMQKYNWELESERLLAVYNELLQ